jgi:hypothetical protein
MIGNTRTISEVNDGEELEHPIVRRRANSSESQGKLVNVPTGLEFISVMNRWKRFFLPSTKNDFGIVRVERVRTDSNCSSLLLPLESTQELRRVLEHYSDSCAFSIALSRNAGGNSPVLSIKGKSPRWTFPVNLCTDVVGPSTINVTVLRFALCADDIAALMQDPCQQFMISSQLEKLVDLNVSSVRRRHALLGQSVLRGFLLLKLNNTEFYVNGRTYAVPASWEELRNQMGTIENQLQGHLPEDFEAWEDDDFAYQDDEFLAEDEWNLASLA